MRLPTVWTVLNRVQTGFFGLLLLWLPLWGALIPTWRFGQYYEFGWLVPPAALFFAWGRWRDLGTSAPLCRGEGRKGAFAMGAVLLTAALGLLVVFRVLEIVDATWRRVLVPHALVVAGLTLGGLAWLRGRRMALFFLPVVVFALTAVPLPSAVEHGVIRAFTGGVIAIAAEALRLLGHPITVSGDVLVSFAGRVEVTEGCSGLKSFQGLCMAALFFGELYRLKWRWRFAVLLAGVAFGLATNVGRAVALSLILMNQGDAAFDRWHDMVGHIAFVAAIGGLFLLARWIESRPRAGERSIFQASASAVASDSEMGTRSQTGGIGWSRHALTAVCLLATVGVELAAHAWFWAHGSGDAAAANVRVPQLRLPSEGVRKLDIRDNVASESLRYDECDWLIVSAPDRKRQIELFRFAYARENPRFFSDVIGHAPEDCMGALGYPVESRFPDRTLATGEVGPDLRPRDR